MNGDFSKTTFNERKHYTGVLLQQGRVQLDADWNEAEAIEANHAERALRDLIGRRGSPNNGFKIAARWALDDMESTAGWQATGKNAGLSVDYVDYLRGVGSLRVSGASEIRKTLTEAIDLSSPEAALTFTVKSSQPSGAPNDTGFTFFIADSKGHKTSWAVSGLTPQTVGVWRVYTCPIASADQAAKKPDLSNITTIGFTGLKPDRVYHFDSIQRDFARGALNPAGDFYILGGETGDRDPGRIYVDGLACQKETAETYSNQRDYPEALSLEPKADRVDLVYLDVWQRHVTYIEDPTLREAALGGLDTCTRVQTIAQVKVLRGEIPKDATPSSTQRLDCADIPAGLNKKFAALKATGLGTLSTLTTAPAQSIDPCQIAPEADFLGLDNRLYRVEIHDPGPVGTATFKWSKDNGSIAIAVIEDIAIAQGPEAQIVKVERLGRDRATGIAVSDWVEIADDLSDLSNSGYDMDGVPARRTGELRQVKSVDPDSNTLTLYSALSRPYTVDHHARVRKWDGARGLTAKFKDTAQTPQLDFGDGVRVEFDSPQPMQTGDYWQFTARGATGQVEKLESALPAGVVHHYCPLALIRWTSVGNRFEIADLADGRNHFPALAELRATDVGYDDGGGGLTEDVATLANWRGDVVDDPNSAVVEGKIANVQQALDIMGERADRFLTLRYVSGDGQEGWPEKPLPAPLIVTVENLLGEPRAGVPVEFAVTQGEGGTNPSPVLTDENGEARAIWTLGNPETLNDPTHRLHCVEARLVTPQAGAPKIVVFNARVLCADEICYEGESANTVQEALEWLDTIKVNRAGDTITGKLTIENDLEVQGDFHVQGQMIVEDVRHQAGNVLLGDGDNDTVTIHGQLRSANSSDALEINDDVNVSGRMGVRKNPEQDFNLDVAGKLNATEIYMNGEPLGFGVSRVITQTGHGFKRGQAIYFNAQATSNKYALARSDAETTLGMFLVAAVQSENQFTLLQAGYISGVRLTPLNLTPYEEKQRASGGIDSISILNNLTPGEYYYVSDTEAGALTPDEPASGISNPILYAVSKTEGYVLPYRPSQTGRGPSQSTGSGVSRDVYQLAHGFHLGQAIYYDGEQYKLAQSHEETTAGMFLVSAVKDADNFTLLQAGYISGLNDLVPGDYYYVSDTTPGELIREEPASGISNPILLAESESGGFVLPYRPLETGLEAGAIKVDPGAPQGAVYIDQAGNVMVAGKIISGNIRAERIANDQIRLSSYSTDIKWLDMPDMDVTVLTKSRPVLILFKAGGVLGEGDWHQFADFSLLVDGVQQANCLHVFGADSWIRGDVSLFRLLELPPGVHTIKVQWSLRHPSVSGSYTSILVSAGSTTSATRNLIVLEL